MATGASAVRKRVAARRAARRRMACSRAGGSGRGWRGAVDDPPCDPSRCSSYNQLCSPSRRSSCRWLRNLSRSPPWQCRWKGSDRLHPDSWIKGLCRVPRRRGGAAQGHLLQARGLPGCRLGGGGGGCPNTGQFRCIFFNGSKIPGFMGFFQFLQSGFNRSFFIGRSFSLRWSRGCRYRRT